MASWKAAMPLEVQFGLGQPLGHDELAQRLRQVLARWTDVLTTPPEKKQIP
jgi:hypothetical protein